MRTLFITLLGSLFLISACGEEKQESESSEMRAAEASKEKMEQTMSPDDSVSADWQLRLDYPSRGSKEDITIEKTSKGYHFVTGPRAIFYKSGMTAEGSYQYSATFTQNNQPGPEAYGLFVGGQNLQSEDQQYLYFLIRQTGDFLIKRRVGSGTETIVGWTAHDGINTVDESDQPVNTLSVQATSENLQFSVNGKQVQTVGRDKIKFADGQTGIRINHKLDLTVEDIQLSTD